MPGYRLTLSLSPTLRAMWRDHLARFEFLRQSLQGGGLDRERLQALEQMDNLFANLDYRVFA